MVLTNCEGNGVGIRKNMHGHLKMQKTPFFVIPDKYCYYVYIRKLKYIIIAGLLGVAGFGLWKY